MIVNNNNYYLKKKYGIALRRVFTGEAPSKRFIKYLGLNSKDFRLFIKSQLQFEFTLDNYNKNWIFDHIVPIFLFDQKNEDDLILCWNYLNIIPMPLFLNRFKGVSVEFAIKELDIRSCWNLNSLIISGLKKRVVKFIDSFDIYHSKLNIDMFNKK